MSKEPFVPRKQMQIRPNAKEQTTQENATIQNNDELAAKLKDKLDAARAKTLSAFDSMHEVFLNKKLDTNKIDSERENEQILATNLIQSLQLLEQVSPGEGLSVLSGIFIRELLGFRNRLNEVEYKSLLTKKDLIDLKRALGSDNESK